MPKELKIVDNGDLWDGILYLQGEPWHLGTSSRGSVYMVKVVAEGHNEYERVLRELPDEIKYMEPYDQKKWEEGMKRIRDEVIAEAKVLARKLKKRKKR